MSYHPPRLPSALAQRGVALAVVLVMVLMVTLFGIAAVRTLVLQERMVANSYDRNLALQSAENVLRQAEAIAQAQSVASTFNVGFTPRTDYDNGSYSGAACASSSVSDPSPCTSATAAYPGLCSQPTPSCKPRWEDASFSNWVTLTTAGGTDSALASGTQQQYFIEFLGKTYPCNAAAKNDKQNCSQYRITVRTKPGTQRASVQLQSYYLALPR